MAKITNLTIKQKYEAIKMVEIKKKKVADVAKFYKCGKTQIYDAIKQRDTIAKHFEQNKNVRKKKLRKENNEQLNKALYEWFCAARAKNFAISGPLIKEKALEMSLAMNLTNFTASNGWLESFKRNYRISFQSLAGEGHDVDQNVVSEWKSGLADKIRGFDLKNIANADETGLFFKMMPDKTMQLKGQRCHGGKKSKERITVLLTTFADGSIGKPMIIAKSNNPRCFKNITKTNLPVTYKANKKAWMTSALFTEYLEHLNQQMVQENRKILLFVDNAACHPKIKLSNVKIEFLPPNCTSALQPLDAGIIYCLKVNYRKLMLKKIINSMNTCENSTDLVKSINVLDAIMLVSSAVKKITNICVRKCFKKCGFPVNCNDDENDSVDISELQELLTNISQTNEELPVRAADYVAIDDHVYTENSNISVESFLPSNAQSAESDEEDEVEEIISLPTLKEMFNCFNLIKNYAKIKGNFHMYETVEQWSLDMNEDFKNRCTKQSSIKTFLKSS